MIRGASDNVKRMKRFAETADDRRTEQPVTDGLDVASDELKLAKRAELWLDLGSTWLELG